MNSDKFLPPLHLTLPQFLISLWRGGDLDLSGEKGRGSGFLKLGTEAEARLLTHIFKDYLNLSESLKLFIVLF